jgi:hypothetical protein
MLLRRRMARCGTPPRRFLCEIRASEQTSPRAGSTGSGGDELSGRLVDGCCDPRLVRPTGARGPPWSRGPGRHVQAHDGMSRSQNPAIADSGLRLTARPGRERPLRWRFSGWFGHFEWPGDPANRQHRRSPCAGRLRGQSPSRAPESAEPGRPTGCRSPLSRMASWCKIENFPLLFGLAQS